MADVSEHKLTKDQLENTAYLAESRMKERLSGVVSSPPSGTNPSHIVRGQSNAGVTTYSIHPDGKIDVNFTRHDGGSSTTTIRPDGSLSKTDLNTRDTLGLTSTEEGRLTQASWQEADAFKKANFPHAKTLAERGAAIDERAKVTAFKEIEGHKTGTIGVQDAANEVKANNLANDLEQDAKMMKSGTLSTERASQLATIMADNGVTDPAKLQSGLEDYIGRLRGKEGPQMIEKMSATAEGSANLNRLLGQGTPNPTRESAKVFQHPAAQSAPAPATPAAPAATAPAATAPSTAPAHAPDSAAANPSSFGDLMKKDASFGEKDAGATKVAAEVLEHPGATNAFMKAARKVAGKAALPLGLGLAAHEASAKDALAQNAVAQGQMSPEALTQYRAIQGAQMATVADPTVIGGELAVQATYKKFAEANNLSPQLAESLRPSALTDALPDVKQLTRNDLSSQQNKFDDIYDGISRIKPDDLPPESRPALEALQENKNRITATEQKLDGKAGQAGPGGFDRSKELSNLERYQTSYKQVYDDLDRDGQLNGISEHLKNKAEPSAPAPAPTPENAPSLAASNDENYGNTSRPVPARPAAAAPGMS